MILWNSLIALIIAIGAGVLVSIDPGFAVFSYNQWIVEMPLWIFAILIVLSFLVISVGLWLLNSFFSSSKRLTKWWKQHQTHTARIQTYKGLLELEEGRFEKAERYLSQSAPYSDNPLVNYLSAAKAADANGSPKRREHYLALALQNSKDSKITVHLTQAQLQLQHGELKAAITQLEQIYTENPKHPKVLRLLCVLYELQKDWNALLTLLPQIKKYHIFSEPEFHAINQKVYLHLLSHHALTGQQALIDFFENIPCAIQTDPKIIYTYSRLLLNANRADFAEYLIRKFLKKNWDVDLIKLYGSIPNQTQNALTFVQSLLATHQNDPVLLLTLGKLSVANKLWTQARDYLEKSLSLLEMPETYAALGELFEILELDEQKETHFKKGLLLAINQQSSLE